MLPNPDKPHMGAGAGAAGNFFYFMCVVYDMPSY